MLGPIAQIESVAGRFLPRLFQIVAKVGPVGHSTGSCTNIVVVNGHIWDGPTTEVAEHLGCSGSVERLPDRRLQDQG